MNATFYSQNRARLRAAVETDLIIIAGNDDMQRKADAAFKFVQESNFLYLTGIDEAGWRLVLRGDEEFLVAPNRSEAQALFDGSVTAERAHAISGVSRVLTNSEWDDVCSTLAAEYDHVATIGRDAHQDHYGFTMNPGPLRNLEELTNEFKTVIDIRKDLSRLRAIKQPEEIAVMKQAIKLTIESFADVKKSLQELTTEGAIAGKLSYDFLRGGAIGHAYDPIVASGLAACTLHYVKNNAQLQSGELVLIDAGAEYDSYAADITRTYAVSEPTQRQRDIYQAVAEAHNDIIAFIKPGVSLRDYSDYADDAMKKALQKLHLYNSDEDFRTYFPHAISHGLGLDVHESLGGFETFMPGMVLTVEPGIYIPEEKIGIRIEDDILVTDDGNENLSRDLPTSL